MNNIVLCGFMGCGKSTVGKRLAALLHKTFVDMDTYIEQREQRTISDIFAADGEETFRAIEHEACQFLGAQQDLVIATGGGAVLRENNVAALKQNGVIVLLNVSADCVIERLKGDTSRPLLQRPDKEAAVTLLMQQRTPLYQRAADIVIDAQTDVDAVVDAIKTALEDNSLL